ncbi:MAG: restriction endonuclease subunit S [Treponema sp.]|nr:restriction endonuclease subunit S [Treponema sp.]MBR4629265.1 restriction endonuclease subunit S [Treponema sp.]
MNTKALKQKILDLAIHGKLVAQNPDDESASELLEKIRAEKAKLVAEKKMKADKKDSFIFVGDDDRHYEKFADGTVKDIEDEIPFEVPEGWALERIGNVLELINGRAYKKPELLQKGKYKVLRVGNFFTNESWYFSDLELEDNKYCYNGDLLYAWSASFGPKIWNGDKTIFHYHIWNVKFNEKLFHKFFLYYFLLKDVDTIKESTTGSTMVHVSMENMKPRFICIPPLAEQQRIVSAIQSIFSKIDTIEQNKSDLQTAIKQAKSKILDLAIHGKLVAQDSNDESASVLLEKIRAEKAKLVAEKKMKVDKKDSFIFVGDDDRHYEKFADGTVKDIEDEIPFELPEGWAWTFMKDIVTINPKNKLDDNLPVSFIPMTLIDSEYKNTHGQEERLWKDIKKGFTHFAENDVAIAKISPCFENRKSVVLKNLKNGFGAGTTELYILRSSEVVLPEYLLWLAKSDNFINTGVGNFSGVVGQQRLARDIVEDYLVPLPPLAEQKRIVWKIEALFARLEAIADELAV